MRTPVWMWAFFACALAVLALALVPSPPPQFTTGWDKSNHLLAFAVMAWLGCKAFPQRVAFTLLGLLAYGALIEVLQVFTPSHVASGLDLLADGLGILVGWGVVWIAGRARNDNFEGPQCKMNSFTFSHTNVWLFMRFPASICL